MDNRRFIKGAIVNIRILPPNIVNQIAAGEVIERPASIVKELIENSLDAQSSQISVNVREGGIASITVSDNGIGMDKEDLSTCIQRHATSKLTGQNLLDIHSFGFRGEALPSICSIARVMIKSKIHGALSGWQLKIEGGEVKDLSPIQCQEGTSFSVSDIFYTTPARLKFLKTTSTELSYIQQTIKTLALSNFATKLTLLQGDRTLSAYEICKNLEQRIQDVLTESIFADGVMIHCEGEPGWKLDGWLGLPTLRVKNVSYLFVNNRPVKDRLLLAVLKTAYQNVLIPGEMPSFVLYLTLPVSEVDMNVHPTKSEVRFRHPSNVRSFVVHKVEEALAQASMHSATIQLAKGFENVSIKEPFSQPSKLEEGSSWDLPIESHQQPFFYKEFSRKENDFISSQIKEPLLQNNLISQNTDLPLDLGEAKAQIFDTFIISANSDSLFIIDQHAAHERVTYEMLQKQIIFDKEGQIVSHLPIQKLLFPQTVSFSNTHLLKEHILSIEKLGFRIRIQNESIDILEIPLILAEAKNLEILIQRILHDLIHEGIGLAFLKCVHKIFADFACHRSIRANHPLSNEEMTALLRQIESTNRSGQCNHGRPSYIKLSQSVLRRLFERS